ncbi:MFS transporter [Paracidobacterium acidisoli]|uniref:MFS transporter n=1 Tax=Paracidobacterium acidisoli TaxID=2303751 RepID=A0A372ILD7_9BACT|nr:MFS transporter [Paracidobacterium acidisoli]MBT9332659.1 MFS transporter [Paracidobacterium acidisoli]
MRLEADSAFPETRTHVRYFLAFWLFILSGVAFLDRTNISITGLQISKEYGIGNQELGWIFSAFLIGYAAFQVPAGWLAAHFGPRRVLTFGVLSWCAATVLTALLPVGISQAILLLVSIRVVLGAGESVIYPAANQFVARWVPLRERGITNGLILAGVGAGSGLTPPILTWLVVSYGWRVAFWFSSVVGIAVCAVWWQTARDTPEEHPAVSKLELREIHEGLSYLPSTPSESSTPVISWRAILHRKDLPALIAGYFSFGYIAWIFFSWFFLYMAQVRQFDLKASAYYSMLPFLSMTVCCLAGGVLSDKLTERYGLRVGRCWLAAVALVLTALFLLFGSQVHNSSLAAVTLAGGAGALYLSQSSYWSVSVDIAGPSTGVFSSIINMGGQIGGAVTASLTPWIAQRYGWTTSFAIAAVLAIFSALCWLTVRPESPIPVPAE